MYAIEKAMSYAKTVQAVCNNQEITQSEVWSFEYDMDGEAVNLLILCDGFDAEAVANDLGLKMLGKVAKAKLYR